VRSLDGELIDETLMLASLIYNQPDMNIVGPDGLV